MTIIYAKEIGFCSGVNQALKILTQNFEALKKPVQMFGALVHNEEVTKKLNEMGAIMVKDLKKIKPGTLIITAHGVSPELLRKLRTKKELKVIDTTCPLVTAVQNMAALLAKQGREILIFGDAGHQEVIGIKGAVKNKAIVFSDIKELAKIKVEPRKIYGLISQTTQNHEKFKVIEKLAKKKFYDIVAYNTICQTSESRQKAIRDLAKNADAVIIIGSKTSANTMRLFSISKHLNKRTYLALNENGIKKSWLKGVKKIGIGTGASTPEWVIERAVNRIKILSLRRK